MSAPLLHILVDMDGVIAKWDHGYDLALDTYGPAAAGIPRSAERLAFNLNEGRTADEKRIIREVMEMPGFYAQLEPIEGGVEALHDMLSAGYDVRIVTSPWASNPTCASDKLNWVRRHLGKSWSSRVVITNDKTLVRGSILVDDKPVITGSRIPEWEHVLFTQPHNSSVTDRRRIDSWGDWKTLLEGVAA